MKVYKSSLNSIRFVYEMETALKSRSFLSPTAFTLSHSRGWQGNPFPIHNWCSCTIFIGKPCTNDCTDIPPPIKGGPRTKLLFLWGGAAIFATGRAEEKLLGMGRGDSQTQGIKINSTNIHKLFFVIVIVIVILVISKYYCYSLTHPSASKVLKQARAASSFLVGNKMF